MKRILVCDDNEFVRKMIKRELKGFDVILHKDGMEAYKYLKNDPNFDFAIIDGEMPRLSGWELLRKIKNELKLHNLPVVMLTDTSKDFFKNGAFRLGATDYIKKPIKAGEIREYIKSLIESRSSKKGKALVVEDSAVQNYIISHQLRKQNIWPVSAYSIEDAIKILLSGIHIDVILMNVFLLLKSNNSNIVKVLKGDERFSFVPIIGIASTPEIKINKILKRAFESGVDDFIRPHSLVEFYARVKANISRSKLVKQLKESSELDFLTRLYNRRSLFKILEHLIALVRRRKEKLSLVMLDVDKFKSINDAYGHLVGDKVLVKLASIIKEKLRKSDIASRFGGDEFCIVLPDTNIDEAYKVVEKIRDAVEKTVINIGEKQINITVSLGVSELEETDTIEDLIKRADKALYKAKATGRNKVEVYKNKKDVFLLKELFYQPSVS